MLCYDIILVFLIHGLYTHSHIVTADAILPHVDWGETSKGLLFYIASTFQFFEYKKNHEPSLQQLQCWRIIYLHTKIVIVKQ